MVKRISRAKDSELDELQSRVKASEGECVAMGGQVGVWAGRWDCGQASGGVGICIITFLIALIACI